MKNLGILLFIILFQWKAAQAATEVLCADKYPNGARLIEPDGLRYVNGNRLNETTAWRYPNGNRLIDGEVWRYKNGNRITDGETLRYENGNRITDGVLAYYANGSLLRDAKGIFRYENGNVIPADVYDYLFQASDGTNVRLEMTKSDQTLIVGITDSGNEYELTYKKTQPAAPVRVKCVLRPIDNGQKEFRLDSNAATIEVKVKAGVDVQKVRDALQTTLNLL